MALPLREERQSGGKQDHSKELGAQPEGDHADPEAGEGEPRGDPGRCPGRSAGPEHQPGDQPDEDSTGDSEQAPTAGPVQAGKDDLGRPLLVEPGQTCGRERERIR